VAGSLVTGSLVTGSLVTGSLVTGSLVTGSVMADEVVRLHVACGLGLDSVAANSARPGRRRGPEDGYRRVGVGATGGCGFARTESV
jgi:hypothetical protein